MRWMKLEPILQSKVSQKEKHQYSIVTHIYGEGNGTPLQYFGHLIGKDSDAGRDWGQEEKGTTEAEMAGWHH